MECREAAELFPAFVDQPSRSAGDLAAREVEDHLRTCGRCQAELRQYQELREALTRLATQTVEPPIWLTSTLIASVRERSPRRFHLLAVPDGLTDPRLAAAGGALLLAGLAAGAVVVRGRRRRRRDRTLTTHRLRAAAGSLSPRRRVPGFSVS